MKQGEIYLVRWDPSVGHEFRKNRPAVVLSSAENLKTSSLVTFVAITKTTASPIENDIPIKKDDANRLREDSLVKVHHISSFDRQRILKYIGVTSEEVLQKIKTYLKRHFDL